MKNSHSFAFKILPLASLMTFGCSPDTPIQPGQVVPVRSALLDAPGVIAQAEAGTLDRGEQDFLVRLERLIPGFGGFSFSEGQLKIYVKGGGLAATEMRQVLNEAYSRHPNPLVREVFAEAGQTSIVPVSYSLSELIGIEQRIESSLVGWSGVGVSIAKNRVIVMFMDSARLRRGSSGVSAIGVPESALSFVVIGPVRLSLVWTDRIRPTAGGPLIAVGNESKRPGGLSGGSLGYNVQTPSGFDYFLTASHTANQFFAQNGAVGDTVWQVSRSSGPMGVISNNPAWREGALGQCGIDPETQLRYDFCTSSDAMLGAYFAGVTHTRKVGTSTTGGVNGNAGSETINGFYSITGVLPPEYVTDTLHHDANKSGWRTGTTSGAIIVPMANLKVSICWPNSVGCSASKVIYLQKMAMVNAASGAGDSGAPVFTGSSGQGGPYAALGILAATIGGLDEDLKCIGEDCAYVFVRWEFIQSHLGTLNPTTTIP